MKRHSLVIALALLLNACAAPATKEAMVVSKETAAASREAQKGKFQVASVTGGKATNPMWTSQVSRENFESALKESLEMAGLNNTDATVTPYKIDANLLALEQPLMGLTFDVASTVNYRVYREGFERLFSIRAVGTATVSDAFVAIARLRLANEKAIQNNITEFLKQLSAANEIQ